MSHPHSKPVPSKELQILNCLNSRMQLLPNDQQHHDNLVKGYIGERNFYHLLKRELTIESIVLYDLLLESNQTTFQIDSLLIFQNNIILFEVKNFEGDFFIQDDNWYVAATKKEITNTYDWWV